jgi:hypothetical protein
MTRTFEILNRAADGEFQRFKEALEARREERRARFRKNPEAALKFTPEMVAAMCKGNVDALPGIMVVDDALWLGPPRVSSANNIHMSRTTFERAVVGSVPIKGGAWVNQTTQHFHFDLQPHHLGGGEDQRRKADHRDLRVLVSADPLTGRGPDDE